MWSYTGNLEWGTTVKSNESKKMHSFQNPWGVSFVSINCICWTLPVSDWVDGLIDPGGLLLAPWRSQFRINCICWTLPVSDWVDGLIDPGGLLLAPWRSQFRINCTMLNCSCFWLGRWFDWSKWVVISSLSDLFAVPVSVLWVRVRYIVRTHIEHHWRCSWRSILLD